MAKSEPRYIIRKGRVNPMCDDDCGKRWHVCMWLPVMDYPTVLEVTDDWEEARDYVLTECIVR